MPRAFVIRPFGTKKDSAGREINFERMQAELIDPALKSTQFKGGTTGEIIDSGNIREDMFALIIEADLVVCDVTVHNANVFYELGIRHALRKKRTILVKGTPSADDIPFDLLTDRYLEYEIDAPGTKKDALTEMITATMKTDRPTDSPVYKMLPSLVETDPSSMNVVPLNFREEVNRAQKAEARGWLRLLSDEIQGLRFQWEGLKLVAKAQWDLKDWDGARHSWEAIRKIYPDDIAANLALANIYERHFQKTKKPDVLEASEQAIHRVLNNKMASRHQKAEALALKGRNQKTAWRLEFDIIDTVSERRRVAMNRGLIKSYDAYKEAFTNDLNHFYPGLNALQMGTVLLELATEELWYDAFDSDREADSYREKVAQESLSLRALLPMSLEASLRQMDDHDPDRVWAEISKADMLFLLNPKREARVISAYRDAIPLDKPFAWDAARGQLALFASLGIHPELANNIITDINGRFAGHESKSGEKPVHLILFAGHRVDSPGRPAPRFPMNRVDRARGLIRNAMEKVLGADPTDEYNVIGLASAAPGTDILAHQICAELNIESTICLPMPTEHFARFAFRDLDEWRTEFLDLQDKHNILVLNDKDSLPRWLAGSGSNFWERGNRWVMKMALAYDAKKITLIALWDGQNTGDDVGGTAHMVRLAEEAGSIYIHRIDSTHLTKE